MQKGFFRKHWQISYRPNTIASLTNQVLVGLAQGTALFMAAGDGFDVKFVGSHEPNLANL
ncbi:hypothetical protein BSK56_31985 [Paenibacillus borealis]|uniref:Uncharacterized protein n=1 Tax=Paenibacillus borealis TaxID=160799 RepID=A0ABX3GT67_PAEBO|nr:hypothetical protein BSK56_31985 [Paenibacillus borealis]